jgi:hypothetical protein
MHATSLSLEMLVGIFPQKYWTLDDSMARWPAGQAPGLTTFTTDSAKALGLLFDLDQTRKFAEGASKLVLPAKATESVLMVFALPPVKFEHRVRKDGSIIVDGHFNIGTMTEVRAPPCPLSHVRIPCVLHALTLHCRLVARAAFTIPPITFSDF